MTWSITVFDAMKYFVTDIIVPIINILRIIPVYGDITFFDVIIGFMFISLCVTVLWRFGGFGIGRKRNNGSNNDDD